MVMRLGNAAPVHIGAVHNVLGDASHHLIVYRVNDAVEQLTPFDCEPFTDTLDPSKGSPLMVTQKKDDLLTLPAGVAYSLDPNQMIRLEMHYINASAAEKAVTATSTMIPISDAGLSRRGRIPLHRQSGHQASAEVGDDARPDVLPGSAELSGVKFFAMTGHEHQFGTNVQVAMSPTDDRPGHDGLRRPELDAGASRRPRSSRPPFTVPDGGGFRSRAAGTTPAISRCGSANRRTPRCASSGPTTTRAGARACASTRHASVVLAAATSAVRATRSARS